MWRWRNFACSIECAQKYINDTIVYRESQKKIKTSTINKTVEPQTNEEETIVKKVTPKRKYTKRTSSEKSKEKIENKETI